MRLVLGSALAVALCTYVAPGMGAQAPQGQAADASRKVAGGGVSVPGWTGHVEASREDAGLTLNDAKLAQTGNTFQVTTGPAVTYYNPANKAAGDYTVKATFTEAKYMSLNNHAHPYGIVIAGNELGTPQQSYMYCVTYGDGRVLVRGFSGPTVFSLNGRGAAAPSVNKAAGPGQSVTQEIAMSVRGDKVECAVNGTVVASFAKADLVGTGPGKLKSTDGVYGFRFGHNTEGTVTGFAMTK